MEKPSTNEILAAAANLRFSPKEIDTLKNALKNDSTGLVAKLFAEQLKTMQANQPAKPKPEIAWKSSQETEDSKLEAREKKQLQGKRR